MNKQTSNLRCRFCNQKIFGIGSLHICLLKPKKNMWRTSVSTNCGRAERQQKRLTYMENNPKLFHTNTYKLKKPKK